MNQLFEKIKKIFSGSFQRKSFYGQEGIRPKNDWRIIVIFTFIAFCTISILSWYIHDQVINGRWFQINPETNKSNHTINQTLLKNTIDSIDARNKIFQNGVTPLGDPSL